MRSVLLGVLAFFLWSVTAEYPPGIAPATSVDGRTGQTSPVRLSQVVSRRDECWHYNYNNNAFSDENIEAVKARGIKCLVVVVTSEDDMRQVAKLTGVIVVRPYMRIDRPLIDKVLAAAHPSDVDYPVPSWAFGDWYIQMFNEPDLAIEGDYPPDWVREDGFVKDEKLYDVGRIVCGVAGSLPEGTKFAIPGLSLATKDRTREYMRGCMDALIRDNRLVKNNLYYMYASHAYSPTCTPYDAKFYIEQSMRDQRMTVDSVIASSAVYIAVAHFTTEAGMGYGFGCTRADQLTLMGLLRGVAYWVLVGDKCYPPTEGTFANTPEEWSKMALIANGSNCDG